MRSKLKTLFTRNIGVKLLSIVLAFFIWIIIMSVSDPQVTKRIDGIPIEQLHKDDFNNLEENKDLSITVLTTGTISIKVNGNRSVVESLGPNDFNAYADFNDFVGINAIPIKVVPKNKNLVDTLEITYQSQTELQVKLVKSDTEMFNVEVKTIGVPDDRYANVVSRSSYLLSVTGPKEIIDTVDKLVAEVDVSKMSGTTTYAELVPVDKNGEKLEDYSSLELSQSTILVEIALLKVKEVPIRVDTSETEVVNGFGVYKVESAPSTIRIAADDNTLRDIDEIRIPYVSETPLIKGIRPTSVDFDVKKYLKDGVYLKSSNATVSASITVEPLGEKVYYVDRSMIEFRNLPEGYAIADAVDGEEFEIKVTGFKSVTDLVTGIEDLHPYVDLRKVMKTGTQTFRIRFGTDLEVDTESEMNLTIVDRSDD